MYNFRKHGIFLRCCYRGSVHGALKPVKEGKLNLHTLSTSRGIDDAMSSDFDVELMPSSENNKLQSAR